MPSSPFAVSDVVVTFSGRFNIISELRVGGQGVVYRATRLSTPAGDSANDDVALKLHTDPHEDIRAEREIKTMEGNRHPNLANLIEHGLAVVAGQPVRFAAWAFIEGVALDHQLVAGPITPKIACVIGRDVATAVDHLWTRDRIVHRDINPKNIMLRTGLREAVLIDLGAAKHLNQSPITAPLLTWGTMGYLSPEQFTAAQNLTSASDVFSLGLVIQECLLGRHPTGCDQMRLLGGGLRTASICPAVPVALANLVDQMLAVRPAFRPLPKVLAVEFATLATIL